MDEVEEEEEEEYGKCVRWPGLVHFVFGAAAAIVIFIL